MTTTLLTAGLVCLIAAIIGGGLKAFGIEMPILQSARRQVVLVYRPVNSFRLAEFG
jgi:hypothetical protein